MFPTYLKLLLVLFLVRHQIVCFAARCRRPVNCSTLFITLCVFASTVESSTHLIMQMRCAHVTCSRSVVMLLSKPGMSSWRDGGTRSVSVSNGRHQPCVLEEASSEASRGMGSVSCRQQTLCKNHLHKHL